jgi:sugar phosphate isomerase/epimerase
MITTDVIDAGTPYTEDVLKAASELGVQRYRFGGFKWAPDQPLDAQIEGFKPRLEKLAALNRRYGMCSMYHTHSGVGLVGASIWDLRIIMHGMDPKYMGVNYDIGHATIEGGAGGWIASFRVLGNLVRGIAVKDFIWAKDSKGEWKSEWTPIGEGMVKLDQFFKMVAASDFDGPLQVHYEYPIGGANNGSRKITMPREEVLAMMKKDLIRVRTQMASAGL